VTLQLNRNTVTTKIFCSFARPVRKDKCIHLVLCVETHTRIFAATFASWAALAVQAEFASAVTSINVRKSPGFFVANFSVTEQHQKIQYRHQRFCCASVMIAAPTSAAALLELPPKIQAISTCHQPGILHHRQAPDQQSSLLKRQH
jgi:hypothetical protein